jgi:hypothetical protein
MTISTAASGQRLSSSSRPQRPMQSSNEIMMVGVAPCATRRRTSPIPNPWIGYQCVRCSVLSVPGARRCTSRSVGQRLGRPPRSIRKFMPSSCKFGQAPRLNQRGPGRIWRPAPAIGPSIVPLPEQARERAFAAWLRPFPGQAAYGTRELVMEHASGIFWDGTLPQSLCISNSAFGERDL